MGLDRPDRIGHRPRGPLDPPEPEPEVPGAWVADTDYLEGNTVSITGGTLGAVIAGTSDEIAPELPAAVGETIVDGTVMWERLT